MDSNLKFSLGVTVILTVVLGSTLKELVLSISTLVKFTPPFEAFASYIPT